jgi:hypothetical protein
MKTILGKLAIASALLAFAVTSAFAETSTANVPFNFVANGKHCSAGVYMIHRDPRFNTVRLQSADGARNMQWVAMPGEPSPNDSRVILTFDQNAGSYALRTVQYHNQITRKLDKKVPEYVPTRTIMGQ